MSEHQGYEIVPGVIAVSGVGIGMVTDERKGTGVTAVLLPAGARAAVDVAGGAPATRETPVLDPANLVPGPDAIIFSGGSALGLRTADGAQDVLQEHGRGFAVGDVRVPIVVAAGIFDLDYRRPEPPSVADGRNAMIRALALRQEVPEGSFGAGTGATVGKTLGAPAAMKGGQGAVTLLTPDGLAVGALVVVNAVGSVLDENGRVMAGPRPQGSAPMPTTALWSAAENALFPGRATTIGAIVTDGDLTKAELARVCRMAHDGLARAIDPVHTPWDGDTLFAVSAGDRPAGAARVGALAAHAVALAVRRAVMAANAGDRGG